MLVTEGQVRSSVYGACCNTSNPISWSTLSRVRCAVLQWMLSTPTSPFIVYRWHHIGVIVIRLTAAGIRINYVQNLYFGLFIWKLT